MAPWPAATKLRGPSSGVAPCGKRGEDGPAHAGLPAGEPTCFLKEIKGSARGGAGRCVHCMPTWEGLLRWDLHLGVVDRVGCYSQAQLALAVKQALSLMEHRTTTPSRSCVPVPASRCHARFGRASRPANMHRGGLAASVQDLRTHGTARRSVRHRAAGDVNLAWRYTTRGVPLLPPAAVLPSPLAAELKRWAGGARYVKRGGQPAAGRTGTGSGSYWAMTTERRGFVAGTAPRTLGAVERSACRRSVSQRGRHRQGHGRGVI